MKITRIVINNYRAFYNERGVELTKHTLSLANGKNLLLYGENGSGKSSLYKALNDLFTASVSPGNRLIQNVFSKAHEPDEQPFVEITISAPGQPDLNFRFSSDPHRMNVNHEILRSVARTRSFMTYRELLRVHFVKEPEVNLFDFLFGEGNLLADIPNPAFTTPETNLKMNDLYQLVKEKPDDTNIRDFTAGVNQILDDLRDTLNHLLPYFDQSLTVSFLPLTEGSVRTGNPVIKINVHYFNIDLNQQTEQYHHFLNEARLSALGICIFLAAHLSVPIPDYKILFLDDIFTGLDMSNRMPLLDILTAPIIEGTGTKTFADHQIFLTTYDRQWYELAKNHLESSRWHFREIYIDRHSTPFDQPVWLPAENDFEKAHYYFQKKHYPACANYQRKICESLIKQFLPENMRYDALPNGDIVPVNKLATFIDKLKIYLEENGFDFTPLSKLKNCARIVLNPLSHDDLESQVYKRELELAFTLIEELKKLKNTVLLPSGKEIIMRKINPTTGEERTYVSELTNPIRKVEFGSEAKILPFDILPLTQKEGGQKKRISYEGEFKTIYGMFCHDLQIQQATDPYTEFTLRDGTPLNQIIALP